MREENFLLHDSEPDKNIASIFSTTQNMGLLKKCLYWYDEETFKASPTLFTLLCAIHVMNFDIIFPFMYVVIHD